MPTSMSDQDVPPDDVAGAGLPGGKDAPPPPGGAMPPADTSGQGAAPANPNDDVGAGPIEQVRSYLSTVLNPDQMQHLELLISQVDKGSGGEPDPTAMQAGGSEPGGPAPPPAPKAPPPAAAAGGPPAAHAAPPEAGGGKPPFPPKKTTGDAGGGPPPFPGMPKIGGKDSTMSGHAGDAALVTQRDLQNALLANDARHRLLADTREFVRRQCGDGPFLAMDSAEGILKAGLQMKGYPAEQLKMITELPALKAMLELKSQAAASRPQRHVEPTLAADSANDPLSMSAIFGKAAAEHIQRIKVDTSGSRAR